jgi:hypothetical protein
VLIGASAWIVVRGLLAREALLEAVPIARGVEAAIGDPVELDRRLDELVSRADTAAALTSDPIWRAAEVLPWAGTNLRVFREVADVIRSAAHDALPPLRRLATDFDPGTFAPRDGRIDPAPFVVAAPLLREVDAALESARSAAHEIDAEGALPQLQQAVEQLTDLVDDASEVVDGLDAAASLLPAMLGSESPRDYLVLSLNNAELRASGGIPGALAVIHVEDGALALGAQEPSSTFGGFDAPVLALTAGELTLYEEFLGRFMQNVTMTPDFARTGELAAEMWRIRHGQQVDGVVAIDPVAVSYLLGSLGPVDVGEGISLDEHGAVEMLLSEAYVRFPDARQTDAFFSDAFEGVFERLRLGPDDDREFLDGLIRGAAEQRLHFWSAHPDEQNKLAPTGLSGAPIEATERSTALGVYFNDATAAKMGYYLRAAIGVASVVCRVDDRPFFEVRLSLTSTAPADAGTTLPPAVTGGGTHGVEPGQTSTNVYVHAPPGTVVYLVAVDGTERAFLSADDTAGTVAGITITIPAGQTSELRVAMLGPAGAPTEVRLTHTPMVAPVQLAVGESMECPAPDGPDGGVEAARGIAVSEEPS